MAGGRTIFALSSGGGLAAVSVIRVSGPGARDTIDVMAGPMPDPRVASFRILKDVVSGEELDEAIVLWMPGPGTFTGEDCAEFHVHGSRAVVARVLLELSKIDGCHMAQAGDFTRRAHENGKIDLMAVEGLADLIAAETEAQRKQAWFHKTGAASTIFEAWRSKLVTVLANMEAAIDFSEEEGVEASALATVFEELETIGELLGAELSSSRAGQGIREGIRVVLAGAPNVGKSSLLNELAQRDAAIVSPIEGTTRDAVEVRLDLGGIPVIFVDTAGLREGDGDQIELLGMAKSKSEIGGADLVLWIEAADMALSQSAARIDSETLRILNKSDLGHTCSLRQQFDAEISVRTGAGIEAFVSLLEDRIAKLFLFNEPATVTRIRHRQAVEGCVQHIGDILADRNAPIELLTESLRLAVRELERLIGRVDVEDLLDVIFRDFCIGK